MSHFQLKFAFRGSPAGRIAICLVLAILFMYNPFLSTALSAGTLTVCHPASHRATVGASELESFGKPNPTAQILHVADFTRDFTAPLTVSRTPQYTPQAEVIAKPQAGFFVSLWFRPPPTV